MGLQRSVSPNIIGITSFHDILMAVLSLVVFFLLFLSCFIVVEQKMALGQSFLESLFLEYCWTIGPSLIIIGILIPSIKNLYVLEEAVGVFRGSGIFVKIVGHQWYWSYRYLWQTQNSLPAFEVQFDSFLKTRTSGANRLLSVDNHLPVPCKQGIKVGVTSEDVIHSWSVPELGLKLDAIPGRINFMGLLACKSGVFYGQCSELCGISHSIMPIQVVSYRLSDFLLHILTRSF